jgi:Ran GTPase-activating protein 1
MEKSDNHFVVKGE